MRAVTRPRETRPGGSPGTPEPSATSRGEARPREARTADTLVERPHKARAWVPAPVADENRSLLRLGQVLVRTHEAMNQKAGVVMSLEEWRAIVGERIASRTRIAGLVKGDLTINVASSAWAQELTFLTEVILDKLRSIGRDVRRLRFRVDPGLSNTKDLPRRVFARPSSPGVEPETRTELPPELKARLAQIDDPLLRAAIADAATRSLTKNPR